MSIPLMYREAFTQLKLINAEDIAETFTVKRTERIWIPYIKIISYLCHLSKNVWNQAQHIVDKEYKEFDHVPSYEDVDAMLNKKSYYKKNSSFDNYHKLSPATSQQILKVHNKSWKGFLVSKKDYFANLKKNKLDQKDYTGMPKEPGYKKKDGEFILIFTNQQIKFRESKDGSIWMIFPKNIKDDNGKRLKIKLGNIKDIENFYLIERLMYGKFDQVRIIPQGVGYTIEIVYDKELIKDNSKYELDQDIIMAIDIGVENLGAITDNIGNRPIIIKGSEIKCVNQWYNKKKAELQAIYDRNIIGKACIIKIDKKEKKVKKVLDKNKNIRYLVINVGYKLDIITDNRNKKVMDELHKFSRGIVKHALSIKRGLFKASKGTEINSDVQGSYNILVKTPIEPKTKFDNVYPKFNVYDIIEGVAAHGLVPKRLSVSQLLSNRELMVKRYLLNRIVNSVNN